MDEVLNLVAEQEYDEALWLEPGNPQAVILQEELKMLHAAIHRMEQEQ